MDSVEKLCKQLSGDQPTAFKARRELALKAAAAGAPGKDAERNALAADLSRQLTATTETKNERGRTQRAPRYSSAVRNDILRTLADVGGEAEVPALAEAMRDLDTREMARWALDRMTCPAATTALAEAARQGVGAEFRVGAINALGRRSGDQVVAALKECTALRDGQVRMAAVEALANQPEASSDAVLARMYARAAKGNRRGAKRVGIARLRLAETLAAAGQKDAAAAIYKSMQSTATDEPQKKAAQAALAKLG